MTTSTTTTGKPPRRKFSMVSIFWLFRGKMMNSSTFTTVKTTTELFLKVYSRRQLIKGSSFRQVLTNLQSRRARRREMGMMRWMSLKKSLSRRWFWRSSKDLRSWRRLQMTSVSWRTCRIWSRVWNKTILTKKSWTWFCQTCRSQTNWSKSICSKTTNPNRAAHQTSSQEMLQTSENS